MSVLRDVLRLVRKGVVRYGSRIVPGTRIGRAIEIERLVCPLRYDVWVRLEFIRLLRDEWALYERDLNGFLEHPAAAAYLVWFREVVCARFHPEVYRREAAVRRRFRERVRATARLWRSLERDGFRLSRPIQLLSGEAVEMVNGKAVATRVFAGDGCHRMACLWLSGRSRLEPRHYELEVRRRLEPLDNTAILIRALPLDRRAYLGFLSRFYCDGAALDSVDALLRDVAARKPDLLPELESVLAADLGAVGQDV